MLSFQQRQAALDATAGVCPEMDTALRGLESLYAEVRQDPDDAVDDLHDALQDLRNALTSVRALRRRVEQ